jgi:uncharacterized membrane protein
MDKEKFMARSKAFGEKLDLRQEGRRFTFATFPVMDHDSKRNWAHMCNLLKTYFIESFDDQRYSSKLSQITFSPCVSKIMSGGALGTKLSYRSNTHIFISVKIDPQKWEQLSVAKQQLELIDLLVEGINQIRVSWILEVDRLLLIEIFTGFLLHKIKSKDLPPLIR